MIRRELKSRLIDLEGRIAAAIQKKRDEVEAPIRNARMHAILVAAVALYGEPKIEEALWFARRRMEEKLTEKFAAVVDERLRKDGEDISPSLKPFLYALVMLLSPF